MFQARWVGTLSESRRREVSDTAIGRESARLRPSRSNYRRFLNRGSRTKPPPSKASVDGSGTVVPSRENTALKVGAGVPPIMSVPTRNQSGSRDWLRIQLCRSAVAGGKGVPGGTIGLGADSQ